MIDFKKTTITELHEKLKSGELSSAEIFSVAQANISEKNAEINAVIESFDDMAGEFSEKKLLSGIPMMTKDNILVKAKKSSAGSKMLENHTGTYNAFVSQKLIDAGASIMGRANMDEFAMGSSNETSFYGSVKNPLDVTRVPGGSSGGSAAAVASGMAMYALGSDTGGSIRQPASYCGLVGMKPSYGSVSRNGLMAMSSSLDAIGPITHSVADAKSVFDIISGYDKLDNTSVPDDTQKTYKEKNTNNKKIGVPREFLKMDGMNEHDLAVFNQGLEKMKEQGYELIDIEMPLLKHSLAVYYIIQPAEASSNLARYDGIRYGFSADGSGLDEVYKNTKTEAFGEEVKRRIMLGTHVLSSGYHDAYYHKALALREAITKEVQNAFTKVDIIATPTTVSGAFEFGAKMDPIAMYMEDIFTVPYNLTGNPAISIPSGLDKNNMPLGMHFVAPLFCEEKLFEVAQDFENRNA